VFRGDRDGSFATGAGDEVVEISSPHTDAALAPYHVDRSKLFVRERFHNKLLSGMASVSDAELKASHIEMTLFPMPEDHWQKDPKDYPSLVRATDLIGQLGDPNCLLRCPALFYEFQEIGLNEQLGYMTPGDLRQSNAKFYWDVVSPYIQCPCAIFASPKKANSGSAPSIQMMCLPQLMERHPGLLYASPNYSILLYPEGH